MTEMDFDELQIAEARLQMSPTLQLVAMLAQDIPFDMESEADRKSALGTFLVEIATAIDEGTITFSCDEARGSTLGLLAATVVSCSDGPVKLERVTAQ